MNPTATTPRVILRNCPEYDIAEIHRIVREGLDELGLAPTGRTLVKPNIVASGDSFKHAYTRPEVVEGTLRALQDRAKGLTELAVGERCGITIPTRYAYTNGGYDELFKRMPGVKRYCFEEESQVEVKYTHEGRLRDFVFTPEPVARADFFVNMPKFKSHPWTTVTFSMKNYIGIQDDRHRLIDHDHRLNEKVADLQYIVQPRLIVIDAITAGEGRMLTPLPFPLKLLILGNNQPAIDAVCCQIIGVDPRTVEHIRLPSERGFGPIDLDQITISGDVTLEEAKARAKGFKVGLIRVEKYFEGTKITGHAGPPPEPERTDYCWGGCPGAIEEAIEILRAFNPALDSFMRPLQVVFGKYDGPIELKDGEKVLFIGDCCEWHGTLGGERVDITSCYQPRTTKDPHHAKHEDIFVKLASLIADLRKAKGQSWIRLTGCPTSVMVQLMALVVLTGGKNPIFSKEIVFSFTSNYLKWRGATTSHRVRGKPYQIPGESPRGEAKPEVTLHVGAGPHKGEAR